MDNKCENCNSRETSSMELVNPRTGLTCAVSACRSCGQVLPYEDEVYQQLFDELAVRRLLSDPEHPLHYIL